MFDFINRLVPDSVRGAMILKGLRWAATAAGAAVVTLCISHGIDATDAASVGAAVGGVILAGGSALYSLLDAKNVGKKMDNAVTTTAHDTAVAIQSGDGVTTAAIKSAATSGNPDAAKEVKAILAAGAE